MTISIEQAQLRLSEMIEQLDQGQELVITRNGQPVAKLIAQGKRARRPRSPGWAKGIITYMADDFDAPLEDFQECMA